MEKRGKMSVYEIQENSLTRIAQAANCSRLKARLILKDGRKYGISVDHICQYRIWELIAEQKKNLPALLETHRKNKEENRTWLVQLLSKRAGVSEKEMLARYKAARKKGYALKPFVFHNIYTLPVQEIRDLPAGSGTRKQAGTANKEQAKAVGKEKAETFDNEQAESDDKDEIKAVDAKGLIMDRTGWSEGRYNYELLRAQCLTRCSDTDYFLNRMYEKSDEENADYLTAELKRRLWFKYSESRDGVAIFKHKDKFAVAFKDYLGRRVFPTKKLTYEEFVKNIDGLKKVVYKPTDRNMGIGFTIIDVNESPEQNRKAFEIIKGFSDGVVEEYLIQHEDIASFYSDAINTIRLITIVNKGTPHILCGVMRIAVKGHVDNWSQGGIAVGIDLDTGRLCTNGAGKNGYIYEKHPVSGKPFKGFQIPSWDKIKETCLNAALVVPGMGFIGWDAVVLHNGEVVLLEGNHAPSVAVMQEPFADMHIGLKHLVLPYLDGVCWE